MGIVTGESIKHKKCLINNVQIYRVNQKVLWCRGVILWHCSQNSQAEYVRFLVGPLERHDKGSRTRLGLLYFCDPSAWRWKTKVHRHLHLQKKDWHVWPTVTSRLATPSLWTKFVRTATSLDLPKSSWKKGIDDLSRAVHSWITQLDGQTVFGTADGTFDQNAWPMADKILLFP